MKKLISMGVMLVLIICLLISGSCASKTSVTDSMLGESSRGTTLYTRTPAPNTFVTSPSTGSDEGVLYSADSQRMIVRTANMTLVVGDIADTLEKITSLAENSQGYVVTSNKWKDNGRLVGTISIRVPSSTFDNAMAILRGLADEVTSENTSAQDVTEEYTDLSAKLKNLEATEAQLLEIMKKAEKVEDILAVQRQLTSTRDEIERTKGRMQYLEKTSETSLITVQLTQSKLDVKLTVISGRNVRGGENVYFNAEISGGFSPYNYKWDFGDKSSSTEESPVHAYNSSGKFSIALTVTDDKGNTATDTRIDYITVQSGWDIGNVAKTAWKGLSVFIQALVNVIIWLGIFSPVWLIGGGIGYWIWRRREKKKAKTS
jgi:PKD repeat protein